MDQVALYRKYRPHNFDNLVGQDHVKTTLINALKSDHVSHAYLFSGPRGTGKTSTARLLAKAVNCSDLTDGFEPCDKCEFCTDIAEGKLIDLIEIDAASNRGIDEVRDLNEKIRFAPTRSKYKVYIIDEVHMMTKEAFNALLKTLEEPPSHAFFILATTEIHKIPDTIISRCQRFDFKRITDKAIMTRLSYIAQLEKIEIEDKALESISKYVDGGLRDAISLLEQLTVDGKLTFAQVRDILGVSDYSLLDELLGALTTNDTKAAIKIIHTLHDHGSDLKQFMHEFVDNLRNKLLESISKNDILAAASFIDMIDICQDAQNKIHSSSIPQLPLEIAVIRITSDPLKAMAGKISVENVKKSEKESSHVAETKPSTPEKTDNIRDHKSLDIKSLKDNWPRITERIKSPALRMSLRSAVPIDLKGFDLYIQFETNFHKNKVMETEHRVELESTIRELFGHDVKIISSLQALEIKSVVDNDSSSDFEESAPDPIPHDSVNEALKIFGGEVVD